MKTMEWISVKDRLPENGVPVEALLGRSRVVENLHVHNGVWFAPDGFLYIHGSPTHWKSIERPKD